MDFPEKSPPDLESETLSDTVSNMEEITEIQNQIATLEDYAVSLELDINSTKDQTQSELDETHITFLTDHLNMQKFELDKVNIEIYLLRKK